MSRLQRLKELVKQRVAAAAEEISGLIERTIAEYEEELSPLREAERRHKLLDAVLNPRVQLYRTGLYISVTAQTYFMALSYILVTIISLVSV